MLKKIDREGNNNERPCKESTHTLASLPCLWRMQATLLLQTPYPFCYTHNYNTAPAPAPSIICVREKRGWTHDTVHMEDECWAHMVKVSTPLQRSGQTQGTISACVLELWPVSHYVGYNNEDWLWCKVHTRSIMSSIWTNSLNLVAPFVSSCGETELETDPFFCDIHPSKY